MGEAFLDKNGAGGFKIKGIIEDYYVYAGENISAGSFVEFVNGVAGQTTGTKTVTEDSVDTSIVATDWAGRNVSAVALSDNRVFIAHNNNGTSYYLNAVVCTISGSKITVGTDTQLSTTTNTSYSLATLLLPNGNVFIAHRGDKTNYYLKAMICSVSGTTITKGSDYTVVGSKYHGYMQPSLALLPDGNVFITHGSDNEIPSTYGIVCTVSGRTMSMGTNTLLTDSNYSGRSNSTICLNDGSVFIAYRRSGDYMLSAMVCTVSGTTITVAIDKLLSTGSNSGVKLSTTLLPDGKVFLVHGKGYLDARVITASASSISSGTKLDLTSNNTEEYNVDTICISSNKVLVVYNISKVNALVCTISGTTITAGTDTEIISKETSGYSAMGDIAVKLTNGNVFIAHTTSEDENSVSYPLEGIVIGVNTSTNLPVKTVSYTVSETVNVYETQVRNVTSSNANGITKTSGVGGSSTAHNETVQIYVPDV